MLKLKMSNYKRIFLDGYSYYLTIVTHGRNPILIENVELLRESFVVSKRKYAYVIDAIVVLPDHIHMIVTPKVSTDYPKIVRAIKYHFSKHCDEKYYDYMEQSKSRTLRGSKPIWQKRFYEHTIRNEKDFQQCLGYIYGNPVKHGYVKNIEDWKYSSYGK
jgi:putative transposase